MIQAILTVPHFQENSLMETALLSSKLDQKFLLSLPEEFAEMRSVKFFHALKFSIRSARSNKFNFEAISDIMSAVFGDFLNIFSPEQKFSLESKHF
jgi:hypothetical protein